MRKALHYSTLSLYCGLGVCLLTAGGCISFDTVPAEKFQNTQRALQREQEKNARLEDEIARQQRTIENLQERIGQMRGQDGNFEQDLVYPDKIVLAGMSGGYDRDDKPGDDGIVLYIQPVDGDGDVVKVAGELGVTLLDLHEPTAPVVIASYEFDVPTTRSLWYGKLMTSHWTVRCPWPPTGPPAHDAITVQVTFDDLLTGQRLKLQEVIEVNLPPRS